MKRGNLERAQMLERHISNLEETLRNLESNLKAGGMSFYIGYDEAQYAGYIPNNIADKALTIIINVVKAELAADLKELEEL